MRQLEQAQRTRRQKHLAHRVEIDLRKRVAVQHADLTALHAAPGQERDRGRVHNGFQQDLRVPRFQQRRQIQTVGHRHGFAVRHDGGCLDMLEQDRLNARKSDGLGHPLQESRGDDGAPSA